MISAIATSKHFFIGFDSAKRVPRHSRLSDSSAAGVVWRIASCFARALTLVTAAGNKGHRWVYTAQWLPFGITLINQMYGSSHEWLKNINIYLAYHSAKLLTFASICYALALVSLGFYPQSCIFIGTLVLSQLNYYGFLLQNIPQAIKEVDWSIAILELIYCDLGPAIAMINVILIILGIERFLRSAQLLPWAGQPHSTAEKATNRDKAKIEAWIADQGHDRKAAFQPAFKISSVHKIRPLIPVRIEKLLHQYSLEKLIVDLQQKMTQLGYLQGLGLARMREGLVHERYAHKGPANQQAFVNLMKAVFVHILDQPDQLALNSFKLIDEVAQLPWPRWTCSLEHSFVAEPNNLSWVIHNQILARWRTQWVNANKQRIWQWINNSELRPLAADLLKNGNRLTEHFILKKCLHTSQADVEELAIGDSLEGWQWSELQKMAEHHMQPGKSLHCLMQAYMESFNATALINRIYKLAKEGRQSHRSYDYQNSEPVITEQMLYLWKNKRRLQLEESGSPFIEADANGKTLGLSKIGITLLLADLGVLEFSSFIDLSAIFQATIARSSQSLQEGQPANF